jgi:hypothetical protein
MDDRLNQKLVIDFKAETKRGPRRPKPEPDWENRAGEPIRVAASPDPEELRRQVLVLLKNCIARLEGTAPERAWEPRSKSWPYTSMGLALVKAIQLLDTVADLYLAEVRAARK